MDASDIIGGIVSLLLIGVLCGFIYEKKLNTAALDTVASQGYDRADVEVFLDGTGYSARDFLKSPGLRRQYEAFKGGEDMGFMRQARAKHDADEAKASASIAIGIAAYNAGSGR